MTLILIAGGVAVSTLACAENPPAAIDRYFAAFMASISEQTSAIELRESHYLNNGLVNSSPRELTRLELTSVMRLAEKATSAPRAGMCVRSRTYRCP